MPWCQEVISQPAARSKRPATAKHRHLQPLRPQGSGYAGNPGRTSGSSMGMRQGLLRKPRVLAWRGKEQRKQHAATGTTARAAVLTAPSQIFMPCPSTEPQQSPVQRGLGRIPQMNPTTLTTTSEARGCGRALVRVCSCSGLPHTPTGLNTCYSRQGRPLRLGPFPKSTGKLTASQGCNGHLGKLVIQSVSQGCA